MNYSDNSSLTASQRAPRERIRAEKSSAMYKIFIIVNSYLPSVSQKFKRLHITFCKVDANNNIIILYRYFNMIYST